MEDEPTTDFSNAIEQSIKLREIYHQLEVLNHGSPWTNQEDVIGFAHDVGELGRMVMASEGRWLYEGNLESDLPDKLAECLWWVFVLSRRLGIDLNSAFAAKMKTLEGSLSESLEQTGSLSAAAPARATTATRSAT